MSTLLSLSNELLLQIIEESRPDSIRSFVRCCKRIWIVGAKVLEEHQQDLDRYEEPKLQRLYIEHERDLMSYLYLAEILLKPRRALYVKRLLVLNDAYTLPQIRQADFKKETLVMIDNICSIFFKVVGCPYIQDDEVGRWVERLRGGDINAVFCLWLTLLPNLETLSIRNYSDNGYAELIYQVSKANQSPHRTIPGPLPLDKLTTISIDDTAVMNRPGERFGIYEICMTLPSLRKLKGTFINYDFDRWPSGEEFPVESNVKTIIFNLSTINTKGFARLLTRTKSLQRLTYSVTRLLGIEGDYTAMGLKDVLEQHTRDTLTYLELKFPKNHPKDQRQFIGSLRGMTSLRHLRLQGHMFIDNRTSHEDPHWLVDLLYLLPASLETLTLGYQTESGGVIYASREKLNRRRQGLPYRNDARTDTYTLTELQRQKEWLPNLRNITCEGYVSFDEGVVEDCASAGIDLVHTQRV